MGAYDNPRVAQIDPNAMARGITQFNQSLNRAGGKILAAGVKSRKEAEANLDKKQKEEASRMRDFDKTTTNISSTSAEFDDVTNVDKQGGFGTSAKQITFEDEVGRNVELLRDKMDAAIEALGQDATPRQLQQVTNEYTIKAKKFKGDLDVLAAGYRDWMELSSLPRDEQDAIVSSFNPELINIYSSWDDGKKNTAITMLPNGGFQIQEFEQSSLTTGNPTYVPKGAGVNMTDLAARRLNGEPFFKQVQELEDDDIIDFLQAQVKDDMNNNFSSYKSFNKMDTNNKVVMKQDKKGNMVPQTVEKKVYDPNKTSAYYSSPEGETFINDYISSLSDGKTGTSPEALYQSMGSTDGNGVFAPYNGQDFSDDNLFNAVKDRFVNIKF